MSTHFFTYDELKVFCEAAFHRFGFSEQDSAVITDVLLLADLYGIDSHGTNRIVMYHDQIRAGYIDINAKPRIVSETPVSAVVDGMSGMGQLVSEFAMKKAISLAKSSGIGLVTVRNSNHYGIAGYYSLMACNEGFLGISMTNSLAAVVPTFGRAPMLGTNPFAFSFPAAPQPFHFDASTSVVTVGKAEVASKLGKALPVGWGINSEGHDELNPAELLKGIYAGVAGLHPLGGGTEEHGGHKGYGFSMVVEILCSIMSGGNTSNHVESEEGKSGVCHFFAAIDPKIFGDPSAIQKNLETFLDELRHSPKADGKNRIYTHGEKEAEAYTRRLADGIPVNERTIVEMKDLAGYLKMDFHSYFPDLKK
ncbi:Ldh family oxidoreductase [Youngiibacter multivorans]|uniref:LDH2 family malate/lactate/ureidoglycolate dehydrogenase n=1 Tax=Youngiibacter multivorans TaxID=937251 RepID=A0ABS4G4J8_9CLOT|nr:Ldh family oxidoreductase [Youngiibacter multivorans]MBP1919463.1 LDH2 family malate/lactate/ureidoglycolate dehydrogenase [Youngiibacter multivorans]